MSRGPHVNHPYFGRPPIFRIAATFIDPDGGPLDALTTTGDWEKEQFATAPTDDLLKNWNCYKLKKRAMDKVADTGTAMAGNKWQEIKGACSPGQKAAILIDGKPAAELAAEAIGAVELRGEAWSGTYVDDVELYCAGDAGQLQREHASAVRADLTRRQAEWQKEADEWEEAIRKQKK